MATVTNKKTTGKAGTTKKSNGSTARSTTSRSSKPATTKDADEAGETEPALRELFVDEIKDIYWAEKKLVRTIPKLQKAATSEELKNAFSTHLEQTQVHVSRLEQVFELLGEKAQAKKCDAMEGLTMEGDSIIEDTEKGSSTRDVGLILAAQKVEHYEIATYGALKQIALVLGLEEIAGILDETLGEEKETDQLLTSIAENDINYRASQEEE
jgi:ferritin-like metal-binding protein YciE